MKKNKAFSLVELLVAVAIMAVLTGLLLASSKGSRLAARDSQRKTELEQIRSALEVYRSDEGSYPVDLATLVSSEYIQAEATEDPKSSEYRYCYQSVAAGEYTLCAYLESASGNPTCGCGADACSSVPGSSVACTYGLTQP